MWLTQIELHSVAEHVPSLDRSGRPEVFVCFWITIRSDVTPVAAMCCRKIKHIRQRRTYEVPLSSVRTYPVGGCPKQVMRRVSPATIVLMFRSFMSTFVEEVACLRIQSPLVMWLLRYRRTGINACALKSI